MGIITAKETDIVFHCLGLSLSLCQIVLIDNKMEVGVVVEVIDSNHQIIQIIQHENYCLISPNAVVKATDYKMKDIGNECYVLFADLNLKFSELKKEHVSLKETNNELKKEQVSLKETNNDMNNKLNKINKILNNQLFERQYKTFLITLADLNKMKKAETRNSELELTPELRESFKMFRDTRVDVAHYLNLLVDSDAIIEYKLIQLKKNYKNASKAIRSEIQKKTKIPDFFDQLIGSLHQIDDSCENEEKSKLKLTEVEISSIDSYWEEFTLELN